MKETLLHVMIIHDCSLSIQGINVIMLMQFNTFMLRDLRTCGLYILNQYLPNPTEGRVLHGQQ